MTLLIFKTAERVFATTAWTAEEWREPSGDPEVKVTFIGEHDLGSPHQRVYFMMSMDEFLAGKIDGVIDFRNWRHADDR